MKKSFFRIEQICPKAHDLNVPVFIDAEESWIQNAIDDLVNKMMQKFNKEKLLFLTHYKCIVGIG